MKFFIIFITLFLVMIMVGCDFNKPTNNPTKEEPTTEVVPPTTTYTLEVICGDGGTSNITYKEFNSGDKVVLTATPETDYRVRGWYSKEGMLLSKEKTYSFIIWENTTINLEFVEKIVIDASSQASDSTEVSGVNDDFVILVECHEKNAIEYIRENLHIYDEYFLDENNKVEVGYENDAIIELGEIEDLNNNMYGVHPARDYEKGGAYVIVSEGNITVYKKGSVEYNKTSANGIANMNSTNISNFKGEGGDFTFVIGNYEHQNYELAQDVKIIATQENKDKNYDNILLEIIGKGYNTTYNDEKIIGGFTCDQKTRENLAEGDCVIFGGNVYSYADFASDQITEETVFGKIASINTLGTNNYPIYFVEVKLTEEPTDFFSVMDVYTNEDVIVEKEDIIENAEEQLVDLLYQNEEFITFISAVHQSDKIYNELGRDYIFSDLDLKFNINDWVIVPNFEFEGEYLKVTVTGTNRKQLDHTVVGSLQGYTYRTITFTLIQRLKFDVDFKWIYSKSLGIKKGVDVRLNTSASAEFSFEVSWDGAFSSIKNHVLNTNTKVVHKEDCYYCKRISSKNKKITSDSLNEIFYLGYKPCFVCLSGSKEAWEDNKENGDEGSTYSEILTKSLQYRDLEDAMKEVTGQLQINKNERASEIKLATVPVAVLPFLNCTIDLYFYFNIHLKAAIKVSTKVSMESTIGVRAKINSVKTINNNDFSMNKFDIDLTGKLRAEVGIKADLKLSSGIGQVYVSLFMKAYPYLELAGILHLDLLEGENYAGYYAEVGVGIQAGVEYNILNLFSGELPIGIKKDVPLKKWGYDHAVLGYANDVREYSVNLENEDDNIITLEELGLTEVRVLDCKNVTSNIKTINYANDNFIVEIKGLSSDSWFEVIEHNGVKAIKIKDGAPYDKRFEDTITISIKGKNTKDKFGTYREKTYAVNLPTIQIKLVGEYICSEHIYSYFEHIEPTCTTEGREEYYICNRCKKMFNYDLSNIIEEVTILPSLGHNSDGNIEEVLPNCKESGHTSGVYCTRCNEVQVEPELLPPVDHFGSDWIEKLRPTCTQSGFYEISCMFEFSDGTKCDFVIARKSVLPLGHTVDFEHKDPTCEEGVVCSRCKVELESPLGHTPSEEATCETAQTCMVCQKVLVEPLGHLTLEEAIEKYGDEIYTKPTCTTKGYWEYTCVCGLDIKIDEDIEPDHIYKEKEGTAPSCEEKGILPHYVCSVCGCFFNTNKVMIEEEEIYKEANQHYPEKQSEVLSTCQEEGHKEYWVCINIYNGEVCGKMFLDKDCKIPVTDYDTQVKKGLADHDFEPVEAKEPTCQEEGNKLHWVCSYGCQTYSLDTNGTQIVDKEDVIISKLPHDTIEVLEKASTCEKAGNISYWKCEKCDSLFKDKNGNEQILSIDDTVIMATGHDYKLQEEKDATCKAAGHKAHYYCEACDTRAWDKEGINIITNENDYVYSKIKHNVLGAIISKKATCIEDGLKSGICSMCNETIVERIPATGHDLDDYNNCLNCGEYLFTEGLYFELIDDKYYVTGFDGAEKGIELIIPSKYFGKEVVGIKENAFNGKNFKSISIPLGIKIIASGAFKNCASIKEIKIPSTVAYIGKDVFKGCNSLIQVEFPKNPKWVFADNTYINVSSNEEMASILKVSNNEIYQMLKVTFFDIDKQTILQQKEYKCNDLLDEKLELTKEGHDFNGWSKEYPTYMPYESIDFISKGFTVKTYKLYIDGNPIEVEYNTSPSDAINKHPEIYQKDGYRFDGFSPKLPSYMPAEDIYVATTWTKVYELRIYTKNYGSKDSYVLAFSNVYVSGERIEEDDYLHIYYDGSKWKKYLANEEVPYEMPSRDVNIYVDYVQTSLTYIRSEEYQVTDSGRMNQPKDIIDISDLSGHTLSEYIAAGCKKVTIYISLDIIEVNNGNQYIFLYDNLVDSETSDTLIGTNAKESSFQFTHDKTGLNDKYETHTTIFTINLSEFNTEQLIIRYGADGDNEDTWKNKNLVVNFSFS